MTYTQFWEEDPYLVTAYRQAYKIRVEENNEQAWLQGCYNFYALTVALSNALSKPGTQMKMFLERPIDIFPPSEAERKRREKEELAKIEKVMQEMVRQQQREKQARGD